MKTLIAKTSAAAIALLAGCTPAPPQSNGPVIIVRMLDPSPRVVATSLGPPPTPANLCADGSVPPVFANAGGNTVVIPEPLGKARFEISYFDGDGLRFADLSISLDQAGVVSNDGGEERLGEFYAAFVDPGPSLQTEAIITPLTDAQNAVTLRILASDQSDTATRISVDVALARRVCS